MRHIKDFTIKEFMQYQEMLQYDEPDMVSIFNLFGLDMMSLSYDVYQRKWMEIVSMVLPRNGVEKHYKINGTRYKVCLNHLKLSAGQFIDFQSYMRNFKLEEVLSVFLIPQYRKWGRWHTYKYNSGYDVIEVQENLYNHMKIGDAQELSNFFLKSSVKLLGLMKGFLEKKQVKERKKHLKRQADNLLG